MAVVVGRRPDHRRRALHAVLAGGAVAIALGMAESGGRRQAARALLVGAAALSVACAFAAQLAPDIGAAIVVVGALAVALLAREPRRCACGPGPGVVYAGVLHALGLRDPAALAGAARFQPRPAGHRLAVRRRLGHRRHGLFRRAPDRRSEALAARLRRQDLVGNLVGVASGALLGLVVASVQPSAPDRPCPAPAGRPVRRRRRAGRRSSGIFRQAPVRRKGFQQLIPGPWRRDGPARRLHRRRSVRLRFWASFARRRQ